MSAPTQIKIPRGWRKLRKGEILRKSDKGFGCYSRTFLRTSAAGHKVGTMVATAEPYIRRIPKKKESP